MNRFNRFPHLFALSLVLVAGSASSTLALDDKDAGLGGPAVKDESVKGQPRKLSGGAPDRREGAQRVPHRGFLRAVMSLQKEDAPANLRLTEAQITSIKEANQKFVDSVTEYVNQHKNEIEKLRESLPGMERRRVDGFLNMSKDIASLRNLDDVEPLKGANTTTEFLAGLVFELLKGKIASGGLGTEAVGVFPSMKITLRESPVAWAAYEAALA
jgi:hypothetical protein